MPNRGIVTFSFILFFHACSFPSLAHLTTSNVILGCACACVFYGVEIGPTLHHPDEPRIKEEYGRLKGQYQKRHHLFGHPAK